MLLLPPIKVVAVLHSIQSEASSKPGEFFPWLKINPLAFVEIAKHIYSIYIRAGRVVSAWLVSSAQEAPKQDKKCIGAASHSTGNHEMEWPGVTAGGFLLVLVGAFTGTLLPLV